MMGTSCMHLQHSHLDQRKPLTCLWSSAKESFAILVRLRHQTSTWPCLCQTIHIHLGLDFTLRSFSQKKTSGLWSTRSSLSVGFLLQLLPEQCCVRLPEKYESLGLLLLLLLVFFLTVCKLYFESYFNVKIFYLFHSNLYIKYINVEIVSTLSL